MTGVPRKYHGATKLTADGNAMLALARAFLHTLSPTQREALANSTQVHAGYRLDSGARLPAAKALFDLGLVERPKRWARLTGLGVMLREAALYERGKAAA